jgi:hypothetical protein
MAQMSFSRQILGFIKLDQETTSDITERLNVTNIVEQINNTKKTGEGIGMSTRRPLSTICITH